MCFGCICGDNHTARPWWPTEQRLDLAADHKVLTDCCYRQLPASETICRLRTQEIPVGGWGDYQECEPWPPHEAVNWFSYASYYDPTWQIECNPAGERSCKEHRRFMRGVHLRIDRYEFA